MAAPQEFAAQFSRTLELFRDPAAKEEQKAQFRALASLLKSEGAIILAQDGGITVNGAPVNGNTLLQRLDLHSIHEITIPADPPLAELFELLRGLAAPAAPRPPPHPRNHDPGRSAAGRAVRAAPRAGRAGGGRGPRHPTQGKRETDRRHDAQLFVRRSRSGRADRRPGASATGRRR